MQVKRQPDTHLTTRDLRDILNHNTPIYHESLILSLEVICTAYDGIYLDPSFISTLRTQGWEGVSNRFVPAQCSTIAQPHLHHPNIAIPVHINGDHWVALCRRVIQGTTYFYYADDLNSPRIETTIRRLLQHHSCEEFAPKKHNVFLVGLQTSFPILMNVDPEPY